MPRVEKCEQVSHDVKPRAHGTSDIEDEDTTTPGVKPGASAVGFRAKLAGVSLWDLVQMECMAGSRLVVLVTGEGGIGYLYFDRGQIVHAVTDRLRRRAGGAGDPGLDQRIVSALRSSLARDARRSRRRTRR